MHQVGYAVSGFGLGMISDRYGRFFCAKLAICLEILAGLSLAFSPNIYLYFVARFFVGVAAYGRFLNGYVLLAEWVGPKLRGRISILYETGWISGKMILSGLFYLVPDYFAVQIGIAIFEVIVFVPYLFIVKESPRWQLTHDKFIEAEEVLKKAAKERGEFTEEQTNERFQILKANIIQEQEDLKREHLDSPSVFDVWKIPQLLKISLILYFSWFANAFEAYASFLNIGNLGGSVHMNVFFLAWAEVVCQVILLVLIRRLERKILLVSAVIVKTILITCIFLCSFHDSLTTLRIIFFILTTIAQGITFQTVYIYTTESFPTTLRQTSLGTCSIFARIGSIIAPFAKELTNATHFAVPIAIFFVLSTTNAILLMLLPDTTDIQLPDNIFQTKAVAEDEKIQSRRTSRIGSLPHELVELKTT